jgi:hypothetical protein
LAALVPRPHHPGRMRLRPHRRIHREQSVKLARRLFLRGRRRVCPIVGDGVPDVPPHGVVTHPAVGGDGNRPVDGNCPIVPNRPAPPNGRNRNHGRTGNYGRIAIRPYDGTPFQIWCGG